MPVETVETFTLSVIVGLDGAVMELNAVTTGHHLRLGESGSSVALIADNPSSWRMLANLAIAAAEEEERTLLAEAITHAPKVKPVVNQEESAETWPFPGLVVNDHNDVPS